jgi:hypothetical protein
MKKKGTETIKQKRKRPWEYCNTREGSRQVTLLGFRTLQILKKVTTSRTKQITKQITN